MKIGPKYKIARRLGASVFEKTQTPKFADNAQKRTKRVSRPRSNFGIQLLEKQKARYTYGISNKQLTKYVQETLEKKVLNPSQTLFQTLESRIDNVVLRSGLAPTRLAARQMVSHGHVTHNGTRVTVPSIKVKEGDVVAVRQGSSEKPLFLDFEERIKDSIIPNWLKLDSKNKSVVVKGQPTLEARDSSINFELVVQFYKR